ncbi:MAG TPA: ClcB-like voltage-gated chloride channel protein [Steroidobacteraceae bacterium]|nr:ClcB-like voltage-gated chloride channel protein [Steroidobacteraceae bacterium]
MIRQSKLVTAPIALLTRLRLALMRHEELTSVMAWAALIGFLGATSCVLFRDGIRLFEFLLTGKYGDLVQVAESLKDWQRVIIPCAGGYLAGLVLYFGARVLPGQRSVDYMEAIVVGNGAIQARPTLIRSLSSLCSIASGGSIGREGPMVQLAGLIGSKIGTFLGVPVPRLRLMVACGASAGITAAYNAPISGALFVAEIVMGSIAMESFGPLLVSAVTANVTIHHFLGFSSVFAAPQFQFVSNWELLFYAVLGVLLGHLAPPFLALLKTAKHQFAKLNWPTYLTMAAGGMLVGGISMFVPEVWGNGFSTVSGILNGDIIGWMLLIILLTKVLSTAITVGSGAVGGVFTPTLFAGAAIGALFGGALHLAMPHHVANGSAYALVGMGGFLAATTHAPLMSILMIFEMTLDYNVVLPLMLACVTAHYAAKVYRHGRSIYQDTLDPEVQEKTDDQREWHLQTINALIKPCSAIVHRGTSLQQVLNTLPKRAVDAIYVVNEDNELVAWVDPHKLINDVGGSGVSVVQDIDALATPVPLSLQTGMSLGAALDVFLRSDDVLTLPVIANAWHSTLVGQVSRHDLLLAVQDQIASRNKQAAAG